MFTRHAGAALPLPKPPPPGMTAQSVPRIDALITDLRMPKMGGEELAEKLSLAVPGLKIMFVSGNIDREFVHRLPREPLPTLLSKPFELRALGSTLRNLLDGTIS